MYRTIVIAFSLALALPAAALGAPELNVPAVAPTAEASSPSGATVGFSVSAYNVTGSSQQPRRDADFTCTWEGNTNPPLSGKGEESFSQAFPLGRTTVACETGEIENPLRKSFDVYVTDLTAPTLQGVPAARTIEATGPGGATVTYPTPTATDVVDGAVPVTCIPASGSTFAIGTTHVVCSSADTRGNVAAKEFAVTVRDTTPPVLVVPEPLTLAASASTGVPATDPAVSAFLGGAWAVDAVDPAPVVRADAPLVFPVGTTGVVFTAADRFGNIASRTVTVTVSAFVAPPPPPNPTPPPAPAPPRPAPDGEAPADVASLRLRAKAASVTLSWVLPPDEDLAAVEITRTPRGGASTRIYAGRGTTFVDRGVRPRRTYTYSVTAVDTAGNRSTAVTRTVTTPAATGLLSPGAGALVTRPPVLRWAAVRGSSYYNVQLWRNGKKILTAWPSAPRFALRSSWVYGRRTIRLVPGTYRWYVWPGIGSRAAARYGKLLGSRTFVVRR